MARPTIDGWKSIATALGRSERWCRYMAYGPWPDPLPVFKVGGLVRILVEDLDAWVERRRSSSAVPLVAQVAALREENAALRAEVKRLTEIILRDAGVFTEAQIAALLEVKGVDRMEVSRG